MRWADERVPLVVDPLTAGVELGGAAGHVGVVDDACLVDIGEAAPLGVGRVQPAIEANELCGHLFVVGGGRMGGQGGLPSGEQIGVGEQLGTSARNYKWLLVVGDGSGGEKIADPQNGVQRIIWSVETSEPQGGR